MAEGNNIIRFHQPTKAEADVDPIHPKHLHSMTDLEVQAFLHSKRERRLQAARAYEVAQKAKAEANSLSAALKIEKKSEQVQKQLAIVDKNLAKLDDLVIQLRALQLQYTDMQDG